ncbi:hypothetical protein LXM94_04245 [Rhizobium sp. TRM95111]|uniref:hypothetical protein n=1 Tax=Rhizobium alarense TaxID=2846851 RepID=UPI001F421014|nr:hypothetical protein [Rhizobium alarense]MCF3639170.1 hypothetical protein [Rhizobium alarense]
MTRYRRLDPEKIERTCRQLTLRIEERFSASSLLGVAREVAGMSADIGRQTRELARPIVWLRVLILAVIAAAGLVFLFVGTFLSFDRLSTNAFDLVETFEAGINTLIIAGLGLVTLVRLEERIKRRRVLDGLHDLRSIIHVIDMHQLTKDPAVLDPDFRPTEHSPARITDRNDLARYLDYCSELLSITGKLAALYAQEINDEVVVDAVNDIEELASSLSGRVWQKIVLIDTLPLVPVRKQDNRRP